MKKIGLSSFMLLCMIFLSACASGETPDITDQAVSHANQTIHDESEVRDASIDVSEDDEEIIFILQVNASTDKKRAQALGETYMKALASGVADDPENDTNPPEKDDLGGVYDHYDIRAGVKNPSGELITEGGKIGSASSIIWE